MEIKPFAFLWVILVATASVVAQDVPPPPGFAPREESDADFGSDPPRRICSALLMPFLTSTSIRIRAVRIPAGYICPAIPMAIRFRPIPTGTASPGPVSSLLVSSGPRRSSWLPRYSHRSRGFGFVPRRSIGGAKTARSRPPLVTTPGAVLLGKPGRQSVGATRRAVYVRLLRSMPLKRGELKEVTSSWRIIPSRRAFLPTAERDRRPLVLSLIIHSTTGLCRVWIADFESGGLLVQGMPS